MNNGVTAPLHEMATEEQTQEIIEEQGSNQSSKRRKSRPDFYKVKPVRRHVIPKVPPPAQTPQTPPPESPSKSKSSNRNEQKHTEARAESK